MRKVLAASIIIGMLIRGGSAYGEMVLPEIYFTKATSLSPSAYTFKFSLWDVSVDGNEFANQFWWEQKDITLTSSTLSTYLGSVTDPGQRSGPLGLVDFTVQYWVQVEYWTGAEFMPVGSRSRFNIVPYAMWSIASGSGGSSYTVNAGKGLTSTVSVSGVTLDVGAGAGITVGADTVSIASGGVTTAMLAAKAVTTAKVADGAVTDAKITGPITGTKLGSHSHSGADIKTGTVAVAQGGTGSSTASGARTNLGAAASGANSDITSMTGLTTPLAVSQGGTGAATQNFVDLTSTQTVGGAKTFSSDVTLSGSLILPATSSTAGIIQSQGKTLLHSYGNSNFFAGIGAGNLTMTNIQNTGVGYIALSSNTTGSNNTAVGNATLRLNTSGAMNTASGANALLSNTTGTDNTANGFQALLSNTSGIHNTACGGDSLHSNTTGSYNTANGRSALYFNTIGSTNVAIGARALYGNTTAGSNIAVGVSALSGQSFSNSGTAWDTFNTAVGNQALYANQPTTNTNGKNNTALGASALSANINGSFNTAIGSGADVSAGGLNNATAIGYNAKVNASNKVRVGNGAVTVIGGQVAWSNLSDLREKKDIRDIGVGLEFIRQLRPVSFRMKEGNDKTDFGFIAQDVEALIGTDYNILGMDEDDERRLSLRYTDFIAPLVKAVQEQQEVIGRQMKKNEEQSRQIQALEERLARLETILAGR